MATSPLVIEYSGSATPMSETQSPGFADEVVVTSSLEDLQTDEQRRVLDTVAEVRKCGLESVLSLPQLVVCGDQSAGKSSVLEALTEIPFPRNDNLCTRFATEIILRRAIMNCLTIKVLPDDNRPATEQASIKAFSRSITDFSELPIVMEEAMQVMGITGSPDSQAFSRDVLSITIEGPSRPQLTLVDIPGLIGTATKGVADTDVDLVAEITERYISQPRTICLAVVSAAADYATQSILKKVRNFDPHGERTLGIITKPDRIEGSGSKQAFVELAMNQDIVFKLGWHVLKNRSYKMMDCTLEERKADETKWFREDPGFNQLPKHSVGIDALRRRLSVLLFDHVKRELPKLRQDLEDKLEEAMKELDVMGTRRSNANECKEYLARFSMEFTDICKAAVDGHYEGSYFRKNSNQVFDICSPPSFIRTRAVVQSLNTDFSNIMSKHGQKYKINMEILDELESDDGRPWLVKPRVDSTISMNRAQAIEWVHQLLIQTRGKELVGNFNPLLIGELFWEQSSKWGRISVTHVDRVAQVCSSFLNTLLTDKCPIDVQPRIWESIKDELRARRARADEELEKILGDLRNYPINYNHYYTDTITKRRQDRQKAILAESVENSTLVSHDLEGMERKDVDLEKVVSLYSKTTEADMEKVACEEALDCLFAIYKVTQKTFIANITTQVIERHIVRDLESIFSPLVVNRLSDADAESIAAEPLDARRERARLEDKIRKLREGHEAFRAVMGVSVR